MDLPVKFFQSIYWAGLATALALGVCPASGQESRYELFRGHNAEMAKVQPAWMGPLIQSDARLSQAVRVSISKSTWPNAETISYGNNHGISLLAGTRLQFDMDPPSFFRNHSSTLHDGFGNAGTQVKWRIASGNAEHGNFAVSALLYHAFAPRVYQNQMLTSFYVPAVVAGKGMGRLTILSELGGLLPTGKIAQQGRGIEWNLTAQVHPASRFWLDVENNVLFNFAGPFDGKGQSHLYEWKGGEAKPKLLKHVRLKGLNPEAIVVYPDKAWNEVQLLSDDSKEEKKGLLGKPGSAILGRQFRSVWIER